MVPSLENYDDWKEIPGLDIAGGNSIFPHMSDDWLDLVEKMRSTLPPNQSGVVELHCLQEWEACCIEGSKKDIFISQE